MILKLPENKENHQLANQNLGNHSRNPVQVQHFYSPAQLWVSDVDPGIYDQTLGRVGKHQMIDWKLRIPKIITTFPISYQMHHLLRLAQRPKSDCVEN